MRLAELPESKTYGPIGHCIYCGAEGVALEREHVIPFSLNGQLVLREASCVCCRDEIKTYESDVLNWTYLQARTFLGLQVYNPRYRAKDLRLGAFRETVPLVGEDFRWQPLPVEDHPATVMGIQFAEPGILSSRARTTDFQVIGINAHLLNGPPPSRIEATGERAANFVRFAPQNISKFMAKIAHGAAVAELGEAAFDPLLREVIRNVDPHISHLVGSPARTRWPRRRALHHVMLSQERGFVVAYVQLFARYAVPPYLVVVGRPRDPSARRSWRTRAELAP